MDFEEKIKQTLFINLSNSRCGNCGKQTLPEYGSHKEISGYGGGQEGCGITWKYLSSDYVGAGIKFSAMRIRPDLEWWDVFGGQE